MSLSYSLFYKQLNEKARDLFPGLKSIPPPSWEYLVSPIELRLPKKVYATVEAAVRSIYSLSRREAFRSQLDNVANLKPTRNHSVLMAYDFHTDENGNAFLVEVNTNASGFMFSALMEMTHADTNEFAPLKLLQASFENELRLWGKAQSKPYIAISDEDILAQKMYPEFLMYRDWFRSLGWSAEFCESQEFKISPQGLLSSDAQLVDLVYNRITDFYFEEHPLLAEAYQKDLACFSPNPFEYWLVGDKQRLIQLGQKDFLTAAQATEQEIEAISQVVIPSFDKSSFSSKEEIWSQRRQYFFKPKRSHGGKSVYRGESVSRKVFERLMAEDILIQRFQPAQKIPVEDPRSVLENWKFDLRFYAYEGQIQLCVARIYQGQVTNFASPMGGYTRTVFT